MNADTLRLILQVFGVVIGGGILEFIRRLINRRAELRSLDTASDSAALTSANAYIITLQAGDKTSREDITALKAELASERSARTVEREIVTQQLQIAHDENTRLTSIVARQQTDLDIAFRQIDELRRRYSI